MKEQVPEAAISVQHLQKSYGSVKAVSDLSFRAERGEILGILGPNGSGKTTTLKSMLGLVLHDGGTISIEGLDLPEHRKAILRRTGAVLEGARNIYWYLSPRENLLYFAGIRGIHGRLAADPVERLLRELDLWDVRNKEVRQFSSGMKQKVSMACAFVHDPSILLLDEPTLGLDVETSISIRNWLRTLGGAGGKTILITSHDMGFIESVCDRVLIIRKGRIISDETLQSLKARFSEKALEIVTGAPLSCDQTTALDSIGPWSVTGGEGAFRLSIRLHSPGLIFQLMDVLREGGSVISDFSTRENDLEDIFLQMIRSEP